MRNKKSFVENIKNIRLYLKLLLINCLIIILFLPQLSCSNIDSANPIKQNTDQNNDPLDDSTDIEIEHSDSGNRTVELIPFIESGQIQGVTCQDCHASHHVQWQDYCNLECDDVPDSVLSISGTYDLQGSILLVAHAHHFVDAHHIDSQRNLLGPFCYS